ncbi:MAG: SMP-30/gluconolactonase/LRE family protein [Flavobacteriaceae bacterium]|nr:SMP-30/gluconolactonase/LRE family protein [Flavobacteriaceae bacterium]
MKKLLVLTFSCYIMNSSAQQTVGLVEFLDPKMEVFFDKNAKIEVLAKGFSWAEGPVWVSKLNGVVFTDVPNNKAYLWTEKEGLSLFLSPSGMTNHAPHSTDEGANGLTLDNEGNLILCQHGNRAVSKLKNWSFDVPEYEILVDHFEEKWLNSPNDLAINQADEIFFTDPPYGLKDQDKDAIKELDFNGIYKWSKSKGLVLLDKSLSRPNGIALSNDEKTVYIGNSDSKNSIIAAFDLESGELKNKRTFFDGSILAQTRRGLFDGLKVHSSGAVFATGPGGVLVLDANGKHLGTVMPGKSTANCGFDAEEHYLYLTSTDILARIKLK